MLLIILTRMIKNWKLIRNLNSEKILSIKCEILRIMELVSIILTVIFATLQIECHLGNETTFWRQSIDSKAVSYQISTFSIDSCLQRKSPGFICISNCSTLAKCVFRNNEWRTIPVQVCDQGSFCNEKEQTCSKTPGECEPNNPPDILSNFVCSSDGIL